MLNFSGMKAGALRGLAVAMMATGLLSAAPGVAWATDPVVTEFVKDVPYVDERGAERTTSWAVVVSSDDTTWGDDTAENWYVLREDVKVDERIEVQGDVKLILADSTLNAGGGIDVPKGSSLTVYLSHIDGSGDINASLDGPDAGIGGSAGEDAGDITFVDGFIMVFSGSGAGIGGGEGGDGGTVTIYDSTILLHSETGAGMGGGKGGSGGVLVANGGDIASFSDARDDIDSGDSIGAGAGGTDGGRCVIRDAQVTAGSKAGFGIGGDVEFLGGSFIDAQSDSNKPIADDEDRSNWSGIIYEQYGEGPITGMTYAPEGTLRMEMEHLDLPDESVLTVPEGVTLELCHKPYATTYHTDGAKIVCYGSIKAADGADPDLVLPSFTKDLDDVRVAFGDEVTLSVEAACGGEGPAAYQWQKRGADGAWTDIEGAVSATLELGPVYAGGTAYRCLVLFESVGGKDVDMAVVSRAATVHVSAPPAPPAEYGSEVAPAACPACLWRTPRRSARDSASGSRRTTRRFRSAPRHPGPPAGRTPKKARTNQRIGWRDWTMRFLIKATVGFFGWLIRAVFRFM